MLRFLLAAAIALAGPVSAAAPERVVSMNLCTDQLALLVAAPGQLVSVSRFAADPTASNMVDEAVGLTANGGGAEQIFLMRPDLVLAGTFTNALSIDMLRRLGVRVEVFAPATSLAEVSQAILRIGTLLGREARAQQVVAAYRAELARLADAAQALPRQRAAYYYANDYTSGAGTLEDEILDRAGLDNAARALGFTGSVRMPLEDLVMQRPFLVRTRDIGGRSPALAYATLDHPALRAIGGAGREAVIDQRWLVCGTPFVTRSIAALIAARKGG